MRWPAEFEPVEAVWLSWPTNPETWPGCLEKAQRQHREFARLLGQEAQVNILNSSDTRSPGSLQPGLQHFALRTHDAWIRDYAPLFVETGRPEARTSCLDFAFNGWGDKYGAEYRLDDGVAQALALELDLPVDRHEFVLEGGSIDTNGAGLLLTTEQCLLHPNRNPSWSKDQIEELLKLCLGVDTILWLPGGITGDDTDGHVDDLARFVSLNTIVALSAPAGHSDESVLAANLAALHRAQARHPKLEVVKLPVPKPIRYLFPASKDLPEQTRQLPASYANFLTVNGSIFVPVFGQATDDRALRILEEASGRTAVPVPSEHLVVGLGALHCLSMQQPSAARVEDATSGPSLADRLD